MTHHKTILTTSPYQLIAPGALSYCWRSDMHACVRPRCSADGATRAASLLIRTDRTWHLFLIKCHQGRIQVGGQGGHGPPKDAEVAFWSTTWLIHWLWKSSNKHLCLKCTKIRLAAGLHPDPLGELKRSPDRPTRNRGILLLRGGTFQLTGLSVLLTAKSHWNTKPNRNVEFPIVPTFF